MSSTAHKLLEYIFFFATLGIAAYLVWLLFMPFVGALALAAIIVTICYPMHERINARLGYTHPGLAAFMSLSIVIVAIVLPFTAIASLVLKEALSIYSIFNSSDHLSFVESMSRIELLIRTVIPNFTFDMASVVQQTARFVVDSLVSIFANTASTVFLFFIALIASYYFFKDGRHFTHFLIQLSPLKDSADERILTRLAVAVRSVALGTVFVALIQGILTAIGFALFGFERAILWGCVAAIGALIPGIGTMIVFAPAVAYLLYVGAHISALLLALWGALAVGLIDNLIGPYLMSRGNNVHPFLVLLSVLGGIALFGPIGFILGPVIMSFFLVLLELYHEHVKSDEIASM